MRCGVLYYDRFGEFEAVIALQILASKAEVVGVALERRPYVSEEKQVFLPDTTVAEADAGDFDVFLIPGGDASPLLENEDLKIFLTALYARGTIIGAICGGVLPLGAFGLLRGKRFTGEAREFEYTPATLDRYFQGAAYTGEDVVVDGTIVTGMGQAFVEFGVELASRAGIYPTAAEKHHDLRWFKNVFDGGASREDLAAIERLHRIDRTAAKKHDIETLIALFTDDGILFPPGEEPIRGKDALWAYMQRSLPEMKKFEITEYVQRFDEVLISGDWAYEWGTFTGTYRLREGGLDLRERSRLFRVLRRQDDGSWKVHRSIWHAL